MTQALHHMNNDSFAPQYPSESKGNPRGKNMDSSSPLKSELPEKERKAKVAMLREEFLDLTQDPWIATVLNQLFYWSQRVRDFDLFLEEETAGYSKNKESAQYGWFYKSAIELSDETMLRVSKVTMRKYLHFLIEKGWISERKNPRYKWDKTSQYRLNFKQLEIDLQKFGWELPGFPSGMFGLFSQELTFEGKKEDLQEKIQKSADLEKHTSKESISTFEGKANDTSKLSISTLDGKANDTSRLSISTFDGKANDTSMLSISTFEGKANDTSKLSISTLDGKANDTSKVEKVNFLTETTSEITNREHTQRTCVREADQKNGDLKKSDGWESLRSLTSFAVPEASEGLGPPASTPLSQILKQMVTAWKIHVGQGVHLTLERKNGLQFVLSAYFQNDLSQWEQFCKRVGSSPFLMGQGPRKWRVSLDWILLEENLLKVLEGNFDDPSGLDQKRAELGQTSKEQEIRSVLASIADPVWKEWCSQLDFSIESRDPVSLGELKAIANARFLEVENDRLIWIGSQNPQVLSRIEDLKFKILPVVQRTFPHAHTLRTLLCPDLIGAKAGKHVETLPITPIQQKGENYAE